MCLLCYVSKQALVFIFCLILLILADTFNECLSIENDLPSKQTQSKCMFFFVLCNFTCLADSLEAWFTGTTFELCPASQSELDSALCWIGTYTQSSGFVMVELKAENFLGVYRRGSLSHDGRWVIHIIYPHGDTTPPGGHGWGAELGRWLTIGILWEISPYTRSLIESVSLWLYRQTNICTQPLWDPILWSYKTQSDTVLFVVTFHKFANQYYAS